MKLLWVDLETTGLHPRYDWILEIAAHVCSLEKPFEPEWSLHEVLFAPAADVGMDPVVSKMHTENGLLELVLKSRVSHVDVEKQLLVKVPYIDQYDERVTVAGSSAHFDLRFLGEKMPRLAARLSHRVYDVSAIKIFCRSLGMPKIESKRPHRAAGDLAESIDHARQCEAWMRDYRGM